MRARVRIPCLLGATLLFMASCQSFQRFRPVDVLVRDAETKQPIPGANVRIWYPLTDGVYRTPESTGRTGADGVVRLQAATSGCEGMMVAGTAQGYLSEELDVPVTLIQTQPASVVVELLAEPRPMVELVVPTEFRGLVKIEVQADAPPVPGQRVYQYEVPESGVVRVQGPPVLQRLMVGDYRARLADGTPLPQKVGVVDLGLRWLKCEGVNQYFVVGTQSEFDRVRRVMGRQEQEDERQLRTRGPARPVGQSHLPPRQ